MKSAKAISPSNGRANTKGDYPRLTSLLEAQERQQLYALEQGALERLK